MEENVNRELFNKGLPKWPALVVRGKTVTQDQAKEIIIKTSGFTFICNDKEWESKINKIIYGIEESTFGSLDKKLCEKYGIKENDWNSVWDLKSKLESAYAPIRDLNYLSNSRIASSWIGGPHGWCNWNGKIGCSNYNIGKWPSVEEVYNEWVAIAEEFKFLELKCQLMDSEAGENESPKPVVEFEIKNGKVSLYEPGEILDYPAFGTDDVVLRLTNPLAERGCSESTLIEAFNFVKAKVEVDSKIKKGEIWISPNEEISGIN